MAVLNSPYKFGNIKTPPFYKPGPGEAEAPNHCYSGPGMCNPDYDLSSQDSSHWFKERPGWESVTTEDNPPASIYRDGKVK